jgi:hypothetical protein
VMPTVPWPCVACNVGCGCDGNIMWTHQICVWLWV